MTCLVSAKNFKKKQNKWKEIVKKIKKNKKKNYLGMRREDDALWEEKNNVNSWKRVEKTI